MRTLNSLKNVIGNFANNLLINILRFISRIIFIKVLGEVYLGVNGLLSNVLGLLALSELGISTAISYSLYKPLADNDKSKIKTLMRFYQKAYRIIAVVVLVLGLILLPFLPWFIKDTNGIENLSLIYLIFLGNMVIGYLFSYKRTLISADQKNYKIMPIIMFYNFLTTVLQIIVLLIFGNYIIYLLMQTICIILENLTVNHFINKQYPLLKEDIKNLHLDKKEFNTIFGNVRALMLHKIGTYVLTATDNIVISKFIGIIAVGIYSNYVLIINMINSFIQVLFGNVIASFGNLISSSDNKKSMKVFNEMNFICFVLFGISSVCFINLFTPFIDWVFGSKFVLSMSIVYILVLNFYMNGMNGAVITIQTASGLYRNDRYVPLIQSFVNLFISVYLAIKIGLIGVFIGTAVSTLLPLIIKPIIVYKNLFKENVLIYFKEFIKQSIVVIVSIICSVWLIKIFAISNVILNLFISLLISVCIPILFIYVLYHRDDSYLDIKNRIKNIILKKRGNKNA